MTLTMTTPALGTPAGPLVDEHSLLLWHACAYAEDLTDAARSGQRLTPAYDAMLEFLHYRLLPYLSEEERQLSPAMLRDEHMAGLLITDHERLRADVDNVDSSRTRRLLTLASDVLVNRLDHHLRREESWVTNPMTDTVDSAQLAGWALPLLFSDDIDLDALPAEHRDALALQRLRRMRPGETVRLHASHELQPLWRRQHACDRDTHTWVYEKYGPVDWIARVTRHNCATS